VSGKKNCPAYKFEKKHGKLLFPRVLYISETYQNTLTKEVRIKYVDTLKTVEFFDTKHPDSDDDDDDSAQNEEWTSSRVYL